MTPRLCCDSEGGGVHAALRPSPLSPAELTLGHWLMAGPSAPRLASGAKMSIEQDILGFRVRGNGVLSSCVTLDLLFHLSESSFLPLQGPDLPVRAAGQLRKQEVWVPSGRASGDTGWQR